MIDEQTNKRRTYASLHGGSSKQQQQLAQLYIFFSFGRFHFYLAHGEHSGDEKGLVSQLCDNDHYKAVQESCPKSVCADGVAGTGGNVHGHPVRDFFRVCRGLSRQRGSAAVRLEVLAHELREL